MTFATGVNKTIVMAEESSFGALSTAAGQVLRRTNGNINLSTSSIMSQEILPSQQFRDWRQGPRQITGTIAGQLSPGAYKMFFEGLFRSRFYTGGLANNAGPSFTYGLVPLTVNGQSVNFTTVTADPTSGTFSFVTAGFKNGDVVSVSGIANDSTNPTATANNGVSFPIAYVTPTVLYLTPSGPNWGLPNTQGTVNIFTPGQKLIIPATGQLSLSYSFEQFYADINQSELFTGCRVTGISMSIPASGFVTFSAQIAGQNGVVNSAQNYTGATAPTQNTSLTAVSGTIAYNGVAMGYIQSMSLQIQTATDSGPVIGSNVVPNIFQGALRVGGSLTAFLTNDALYSNFLNENGVSLSILLTSGPTTDVDGNTSQFFNIYLPLVYLASYSKTDSDRAIMRTFSFVALEQPGAGSGGVYDDTTIVIQDSAA